MKISIAFFIFISKLSKKLNRIQNGLFLSCSRIWGGAKKPFHHKICHKYPAMIKLGIVIPYLKKIKKYMNHVTSLFSYAGISIFDRKSANLAISRNTSKDWILIYNFYFFSFFWVFENCFNKHVYSFDDVSKNGCSGSL